MTHRIFYTSLKYSVCITKGSRLMLFKLNCHCSFLRIIQIETYICAEGRI